MKNIIIQIEKYYYSNKYLLKLKIDFDFSENKEISRKNSGESLFNLGEELVERINEGSTNFENKLKELMKAQLILKIIIKYIFILMKKKKNFVKHAQILI